MAVANGGTHSSICRVGYHPHIHVNRTDHGPVTIYHLFVLLYEHVDPKAAGAVRYVVQAL